MSHWDDDEYAGSFTCHLSMVHPDDMEECHDCGELIEDPNEINWTDRDEPLCPDCAAAREDEK